MMFTGRSRLHFKESTSSNVKADFQFFKTNFGVIVKHWIWKQVTSWSRLFWKGEIKSRRAGGRGRKLQWSEIETGTILPRAWFSSSDVGTRVLIFIWSVSGDFLRCLENTEISEFQLHEDAQPELNRAILRTVLV